MWTALEAVAIISLGCQNKRNWFVLSQSILAWPNHRVETLEKAAEEKKQAYVICQWKIDDKTAQAGPERKVNCSQYVAKHP